MNNKIVRNVALAVLVVGLVGGCNSDLTNDASPVALIVTQRQDIHTIDMLGGEGCDRDLGEFFFQAVPKNNNVTGDFVQIRITRYRVSYRRTDGGTAVPSPFVVPTNFIVGDASNQGPITSFASGIFGQAPFISLFPNNGGRDAETLRPFIRMEVIHEFFGETLAGDNVYATSTKQLEFCFDCNGCTPR